MKRLLEEVRLCWWKRAYRKIWARSTFKDHVTFSTETEDDAKKLVGFIYNNIKPTEGNIVLDVGCGNGVLAERVFSDCDLLIQTDYSFDAIKLIKTNDGLVKKYILQSDARNLPFKEGIFDYIFLYSLLHYSGSAENAKKWIKNMLILLKNGGKLYLGDIPIKEKLYRELGHKLKNIRTLNHIKYYFAEFMQNSFSIDNFLDIQGIGQLKVIPQPKYLRFSAWRVDVEIKKNIDIAHE